MTPSEELVFKLCTKSFLSLWSYPNPRGKKGKELCDILVVCEPDILIFSVKEIDYKETGDTLGWDRWRREAVDKSCNQIYGAERWINSNTHVIDKDGKIRLPIPLSPERRIHRVAVALGSHEKVPFYFGDFGKGFVHVLNENSLNVLMNQLDTITDFVEYLNKKEEFFQRGVLPLMSSEEDLLAFYLSQNRELPAQVDTLVLDENLWWEFSQGRAFLAKKQADQVSYIWDKVIEELYETFIQKNYIPDAPHASTELNDFEKAIRVMARETRFARRNLSQTFVSFINENKNKRVRSRFFTSSMLDTTYVFLISSYDIDREFNFLELHARCFVARGLSPDKKIVVGLLIEFSDKQPGATTSICYWEIPEWTKENQEQMIMLQNELGYFAGSLRKGKGEDEYPSS